MGTPFDAVVAVLVDVPDASGPDEIADGVVAWSVASCSCAVHVQLFAGSVGGGPPMLRLLARLLDDVEPSHDLLIALNAVNSRTSLHKVYTRDRAVILEHDMLATTLEHAEFAVALSEFRTAADRLDTALRQRFGGVANGADVLGSFDA